MPPAPHRGVPGLQMRELHTKNDLLFMRGKLKHLNQESNLAHLRVLKKMKEIDLYMLKHKLYK